MYYLLSSGGHRVRMRDDWVEEFERIKWNEGESCEFYDSSGNTIIKTEVGKNQGQRYWIYITRWGDVYDRGRVVEY